MMNQKNLKRMLFTGIMLLCWAMTAHEASAAIPSGAMPWAYSSLSYRREVQLPPNTTRNRTNAPVWVDLKPLGAVDLATIKVDEITTDKSVNVAAAAYAQPSGRDPRAYWVAPGVTAMGRTRRFLLYYNKLSSTPAYSFSTSRSGSTFGSLSAVRDGITKFKYNLKGDRIELMRAGRDAAGGGNPGHAYFYENNASMNVFRDLKNGYAPLAGIKLDYALYGAGFTNPVVFYSPERYFEALKWDRNGPTIAMNVRYSIKEQVAHRTEVTHRLFQGLPIMEYSVAVTPTSGQAAEFSNDTFHARRFYWNTSVYSPSRMITDIGYDGPLSSDAKSKNWMILVNNSDQAYGMFTFRPGTKRQSSGALQEYGNLASDQGSVYVYFGLGKSDELKLLFSTMKRGYPLGVEERQGLTFMSPPDSARFVEGETISAVIAGSSAGNDAKLTVKYPDGSVTTLKPTTGLNKSYTFNLGVVGSKAKFGPWLLTATSGSRTRSRQIFVSKPDHPRLLFTYGELQAMRARWQTDPRYRDHVRSRLINRAERTMSGPSAPSALSSAQSPRDYGRNLLNLAGALLMDPNNSRAGAYRSRMWSDFRKMMAWKEFDAIRNNVPYFKSDDVERGEALQSLACVYDWFYYELSVADRRLYAERFANFADSLMACDYANLFYPRWSTYNFITNNRAVLQCSALAALDRVTALEIPDHRHAPWRNRLNILWRNVTQSLCSDGSWNEGQSYHALSLLGINVWAEIQRLNLGSAAFYNSVPWFREMPKYLLYGMMPGRVGNYGGLMPFGNCNPEPFYSLQTDMALLGMRGNAVAQWIAENSSYDRVEPFQAIWMDYGKPEATRNAYPNWHFFNRRGIFVYRSSWNNDAMYFAAKCGEYWGGHEHPDAGTFVIHKNGYPYIAAPHYVNRTDVTNENILVANGKGPRGRAAGNEMYSEPVDPSHWGRTLRALGSPAYFNVLMDPLPAYEDGSNLTSYRREFVGFPDMVIVRDAITASAPTSLRLLLHGYQTDPQTSTQEAYDPNQYPKSLVFESAGGNKVLLYPNKSRTPNEKMSIYNVSRGSWVTSIGAWWLTPAYVPGYLALDASRGGNSKDIAYQRGGQLSRTLTASSASALQLLSLKSDSFSARAWNSTVADDGVIVTKGSTAVARVVWPKNGQMRAREYRNNETEKMTVIGAMAMRNYENYDFGGRDLYYLRDDSAEGGTPGVDLVNSATPVTILCRTAMAGDEAWIACNSPASLTLYTPTLVKRATFDGKPVAFTTKGVQTTFQIPATPQGGHLVLSSM